MRTHLFPVAAASSSLIAVVAVSMSQFSPQTASVMSPIQCTAAAATYTACVETKYGACKGLTSTALVTCMQTAAKSGSPCNPPSLTACLSASCKAAVTALQQCAQRVKTACTGKTGSALETCIKQTKATGCDPGPVQACIAEMQAAASSISSNSSRSAISRSADAPRSAPAKKPWWQK